MPVDVVRLRSEVSPALLFKEPRANSELMEEMVFEDEDLEVLAKRNSFVQLRARREVGPPRADGWLPAAFIRTTEEPIPGPAIEQERFLILLDNAAVRNGADRDFLFAVAMAESGVQNIPTGRKKPDGSPASSAFGPFQILEGTWADYIAGPGKALNLTPRDRMFPRWQVEWAAWRHATSAEEIAKAIGRLPLPAELYLLHVFGPSGGRKLALADPGSAVGDHLSAAQMANNPGFFPEGSATKVSTTIEKSKEKLAPGYQRAAQLARQIDPTLASPAEPASVQPDDPPWLKTALGQLAKDVVQTEALNPEIAKYFSATGFPTGLLNAETDWCGAFVGWCMANCDDQAIVQSAITFRPKSASAAAWKDWGTAISGNRRGAVAIVPGGGASGSHVGFLLGEREDGKVGLLAGNQRKTAGASPSVCVVFYAPTAVLQRRWSA